MTRFLKEIYWLLAVSLFALSLVLLLLQGRDTVDLMLYDAHYILPKKLAIIFTEAGIFFLIYFFRVFSTKFENNFSNFILLLSGLTLALFMVKIFYLATAMGILNVIYSIEILLILFVVFVAFKMGSRRFQ
ncbi:hypothetical protein LAG90_02615 [Marinilongibacter aquaticus]|uniref:hypothetical protein n=1 Tax=Marinilongibacter aquaticus TaxID=2975157 RepID=UPI0021BD1E09|nr:hypothetical protein [Marinilongibacter aquaticus]UBM59548.1 hypothetical protein LAG90_02615 [Marinilongibacter aquaticus]